MDKRSLQLIEFDSVTRAIAARAACSRAAARLEAWRPLQDRAALAAESALLAEALHRQAEPEAWCHVASGDLSEALAAIDEGETDGAVLRAVLDWLEAAAATQAAWDEREVAERHPRLAALIAELPDLSALRAAIAHAIDEAGNVRDQASPALARLRAEVANGERKIAHGLERWAKAFGPEAYVTRQGERQVAMVPAAGFPRRRAIVHDTSASGQSLLVEPLEWCSENNSVIEARRAALEEERRVILALAGQTLAEREALERLEEGLVRLDTLRARARWAQEVEAVALLPAGDSLRLSSARHPLLAMGVGVAREAVVPLDLELHTSRVPGKVLLVSGPNMGGKTVLLKTVGLAVALAHAAMPVTAAEGSRVPEVDELVADIGDEQSLAQGLSTYAAHLKALAEMTASASPRTLLLADEMGAGTDPEDGAALSRSLLEHFAERGAWVVASTHLGTLKRLAGEVQGVENGSLEFDLENLAPRYRFLPGVPGSSHALPLAERLGFPAPVLERARGLRPQGAQEMERLMAELADATRQIRAERERLAEARQAAEQEAATHREATQETRKELAAMRKQLTRESEVLLGRVRELWQTVQREAKRGEKTRARSDELRREMAALEHETDELAQRANGTEDSHARPAAILPGARVKVLDLGVEAEVVSGPDGEGRVQLRRGSWSIQSHVGRLAEAVPAPVQEKAAAGVWAAPEAIPLELDLRGMEASDALGALDQGIDRAVLGGLSELRVIHGVGRGILRAAVEKHLHGHPQVAGQRPGEVGEGGRGVTVARLR